MPGPRPLSPLPALPEPSPRPAKSSVCFRNDADARSAAFSARPPAAASLSRSVPACAASVESTLMPSSAIDVMRYSFDASAPLMGVCPVVLLGVATRFRDSQNVSRNGFLLADDAQGGRQLWAERRTRGEWVGELVFWTFPDEPNHGGVAGLIQRATGAPLVALAVGAVLQLG